MKGLGEFIYLAVLTIFYALWTWKGGTCNKHKILKCHLCPTSINFIIITSVRIKSQFMYSRAANIVRQCVMEISESQYLTSRNEKHPGQLLKSPEFTIYYNKI